MFTVQSIFPVLFEIYEMYSHGKCDDETIDVRQHILFVCIVAKANVLKSIFSNQMSNNRENNIELITNHKNNEFLHL